MIPRIPIGPALAALAALVLGLGARAQVVVLPPNFQVTEHATGLLRSGESMAVDRFGNVYVSDDSLGFGDTSQITQVLPGGQVVPDHSGGFGNVGQLAYNPTDGFVYLVAFNPILPVLSSEVWRLEPNGGATMVFHVNLTASGFTIDNQGVFYFGGGGVQGPGIYAAKPPTPFPPALTVTFQTAGFGDNAILQALTGGDVLIADGDEVQRWIPGSAAPLPYYDSPGPFPNNVTRVNSLARTPFNQIGNGATIGVNSLSTLALGGLGSAFSAGPTGDLFGQTSELFAQEAYSLPEDGMLAIADGLRQDLYWYTETGPSLGTGTAGGAKRLFKITQVPAVDSPGSLFVALSATQASFDLYGPKGGGDPFILGLFHVPPGVALAQTFLPPYGVLDLVPGTAGYVNLLDGIGFPVPPNPFAAFPPGGHFAVSFPIPPGLSGLEFLTQDHVLSPEAPNGTFFISNLVLFQVP